MNFDIDARKRIFEKRRAETKRPKATRYYLDEYMKCLDMAVHMREARSLKALWSNCEIIIHPEELIAGIISSYEPVGFNYGVGTYIDHTARDALIYNNNYSQDEIKALDKALEEVDKRRYHRMSETVHTEAELKSINAVAATSTFFAGHLIPDYDTIISIGFDGYRAEIDKQRKRHSPEKQEFFDVMDVMLDAAIIFIERCSEATSGKLCDIFKHIAHKPPETFHQALQLVWIVHMLFGNDSFGRFDSYLKPFFEKEYARNEDLSEYSDYTNCYDYAYELIVDFFLKIEQVNSIQNMNIGGVDKNGNDNHSALTLLVLKATRELGYKGPNLCLFVTPSMPDFIWDEALACIASGIGLPAIYNNQMYIDMLLNHGYSIEEARGFGLAGCSQLMIPGKCNFMNDIGMFNAMKVGEIALYDGYDPITDTQVGLKTGAEFESFEELYNAFIKQLDYFLELEISLQDRDNIYRAECEGYVLRTLFTDGCLDKAAYVLEGGAKYNGVELEIIGITNLADHLYAIKQLVFDEKQVTYGKLKDALSRNWEGYDELRAMFKSAPKFGNGHEGVDALRAELTEHIYKFFNSKPGTYGGIYIPGEVIFTAHDWNGAATGATADGRKSGEVLADSAGASGGMDINGPTALMQSVLKLPVDKYKLTSVVLNLRFLPDTIRGTRSSERVKHLFEGFFKQGGMQLQVNVFDVDMLHAAQADPDNHKSVIVRVGGYSDYFVNITKALQDEIIERTAY